MYRSNICKLIASPCMSICMGRKRHRKFHKGQSLACKTLFFLWGFVERKYPACSRAESANARVEKETKERVNWGCTAKSDWRQTGTSRGYFYDVTLQTWGWLWDAVAGKGRAPAIIVSNQMSAIICWSVLRGWFHAKWYSSTPWIQQQVFEGIKHKTNDDHMFYYKHCLNNSKISGERYVQKESNCAVRFTPKCLTLQLGGISKTTACFTVQPRLFPGAGPSLEGNALAAKAIRFGYFHFLFSCSSIW